MRRLRRYFPELAVLSVFAAAGVVVLFDTDPPAPPPAAEQAAAPRLPQVGPTPDPDDPTTWQTSDQVPGEIAAPLEPGQRAALGRTLRFRYEAAPGVQVSAFDARTVRGPVRYFVTRVKWTTPGISIDYANGDRVRRTQPVTEMIGATQGIVAGVNGDFFDITDTGAPLGIGRDRAGVLHHAIDEGWNQAISVNTEGKWHVGELPMVASVDRHPEILVTNYNSPRVKINGTGIYDWRFGRAAGYGWTDGQRRQVRYLQVVDGRVVANSTTLPTNAIKGTLVVARGDVPEDRLRAIPVGTRLQVRYRLDGAVAMAITGNAVLLKKRQLVTSDDTEMHPRTAVGVDRDTKELIFLVVDGRQDFSRGYTMVELGRMLLRLGAEDALNFDGGGSTTLAAVREGVLKVLNSPSDGAQRPVPNGVEITYNAPAG